MQIDQKIIDRLDGLIAMGRQVLQTANEGYVGAEEATQWAISGLSILGRVFGRDSDYYRQLDQKLAAKSGSIYSFGNALQAQGILQAAKDDYEHDMLFDTRALIEAEVFGDFLEQAEHLLKSGYHAPAAVIVGAVLEDGLRKLCDRNNIALPANATINPLNDALARANVYNKLMQKRITELADIRNNAAHGKWNEFSNDDVADMLKHVQDFMTDHFS